MGATEDRPRAVLDTEGRKGNPSFYLYGEAHKLCVRPLRALELQRLCAIRTS